MLHRPLQQLQVSIVFGPLARHLIPRAVVRPPPIATPPSARPQRRMHIGCSVVLLYGRRKTDWGPLLAAFA